MPSPTHIYTSLLLLLLFYTYPTRAQQTQLHGTVLSTDGKAPITGAGVINLTTRKSAVTDTDGYFSLAAQPLDSLLVRAVGFKPTLYLVKEKPVPGKRLTIMLQEDSVLLQEVQVQSMPSEEMIQRALRNWAQEKRALVQRPGYNPALEPPPPPPEPLPNMVLNPASYFSREGKQRRKLKKHLGAEEEMRKQTEAERIRAKEEKYNSFFIDSTSHQ